MFYEITTSSNINILHNFDLTQNNQKKIINGKEFPTLATTKRDRSMLDVNNSSYLSLIESANEEVIYFNTKNFMHHKDDHGTHIYSISNSEDYELNFSGSYSRCYQVLRVVQGDKIPCVYKISTFSQLEIKTGLLDKTHNAIRMLQSYTLQDCEKKLHYLPYIDFLATKTGYHAITVKCQYDGYDFMCSEASNGQKVRALLEMINVVAGLHNSNCLHGELKLKQFLFTYQKKWLLCDPDTFSTKCFGKCNSPTIRNKLHYTVFREYNISRNKTINLILLENTIFIKMIRSAFDSLQYDNIKDNEKYLEHQKKIENKLTQLTQLEPIKKQFPLDLALFFLVAMVAVVCIMYQRYQESCRSE